MRSLISDFRSLTNAEVDFVFNVLHVLFLFVILVVLVELHLLRRVNDFVLALGELLLPFLPLVAEASVVQVSHGVRDLEPLLLQFCMVRAPEGGVVPKWAWDSREVLTQFRISHGRYHLHAHLILSRSLCVATRADVSGCRANMVFVGPRLVAVMVPSSLCMTMGRNVEIEAG